MLKNKMNGWSWIEMESLISKEAQPAKAGKGWRAGSRGQSWAEEKKR